MFVANGWIDYELIDAAQGNRLERWGEYILVRPDPQIIWKGSQKSPYWKKAHGVYQRSSEGGGCWTVRNMPDEWEITYGQGRYKEPLKFGIMPMGFKHTGLFPEQAANWDWMTDIIQREDRVLRVLNLFAYTGGATIAAAKAGARVCHVDASKGMVAKAKINAERNRIPDNRIRYIVDDCFKFVQREIRRGVKYDGVILDPPSFGRGPGGERWIIEQNLDELIASIAQLLSDNPRFVLLNSYTTGLSPSSCGYILHTNIATKYGGTVENGELGLPVTAEGICLPCGASSRLLI